MKEGRHNGGNRGFTLVEILVVLVIVALLFGLALGLNSTGIESARLVGDAEKLVSQLSLGQQIAISENRPVEVRFFKFIAKDRPGDSSQYLAYQLWRIQNDGSDAEPVDNPIRLNDGIVISANPEYSSILSLPSQDGELNADERAQYVAFQFLPSGETNLPPQGTGGGKHWFVTFFFVQDEQSGSVPLDFVTVQVDPFTGSTRKLRL